MLGLFGGNDPVQNAVNESGDGGHGGSQIVGYVGYEGVAHLLQILQCPGHLIEGDGQLGNLILSVNGNSDIKLSHRHLFGGAAHIPQGRDDSLGDEVDGNEGGQHDPQSRDHHGSQGGADGISRGLGG